MTMDSVVVSLRSVLYEAVLEALQWLWRGVSLVPRFLFVSSFDNMRQCKIIVYRLLVGQRLYYIISFLEVSNSLYFCIFNLDNVWYMCKTIKDFHVTYLNQHQI